MPIRSVADLTPTDIYYLRALVPRYNLSALAERFELTEDDTERIIREDVWPEVVDHACGHRSCLDPYHMRTVLQPPSPLATP